MEALAANKPKTAPYDTEAQVVRVEGSTAWVHIPGGVDETPVAMTINASAGDTVRVRVGNGSAWLVGNDTAPPTDDHTAIIAARQAAKAAEIARKTVELTEDLNKRIANANGLYETRITQPGGATITYMHNKPNLADSDIQMMISDVGVLVTANGTDASPTWYGLTVDGNLIANILQANGINADWIDTGALVIYDDDDNEIFRADKTDKIFRWNMGRSEMTDNGSLTLYDGGDFGTQASFNIENTELLNLARLTLKSHSIDMWDSTGTVNDNIQPTGIYIGGGNYGTIFNVSPSAGSYGSGSAHCEINGHDLEYWIENLNKEDYTLSFSGSSSYFDTPSTWSVYARKSINTVQFQFNINMKVKDTSTTERVFTTLPSKYRPYRDVFKILEAQTGNRVILIIRNNGNVGLMNISGAAFTGFIRDSITWVK